MYIPEFDEIIEPNDQTEARREHLERLRALVGNVYPNKYERTRVSGAEDTVSNLLSFEPIAAVAREIKAHIATLNEGEKPAPELKESLNARLKEIIAENNGGNESVRISGRLTTTPRTMGKAAFVHLSDGANRLQIYVRRDDVQGVYNGGLDGENPKSEIRNPKSASGWDLFKLLDGGDFVGVGGFLFLTNTGELSVHVETLQFLSKALLPMPDKMHGIADQEINRRYRYADLIASSLRNKTDEEIEEEKRAGVRELTTREVFERRAKLISGMRRFLDDAGFIEVETPMLTPKATGAAAKPFSTFHEALKIPLYARIAPELYLKRLTVGGFEKVYELNRNFRNEGLSNKHNPEFTMLEFYCAYMDVNGMMNFSEAMIKESVRKATGGSLQVKYDLGLPEIFNRKERTVTIDFFKFDRLTMIKAIINKIPDELKQLINEDLEQWLRTNANVRVIREFWWWFQDNLPREVEILDDTKNVVLGEKTKEERNELITNKWNEINDKFSNVDINEAIIDKEIVSVFEEFVEKELIQPTFIIDYPKSISPLSKASPDNPNVAERFELFINGMECANGFSELNDPQEQYERFRDQMNERETGDEEAMVLDEDYIRALAYGMPPAAGIGIGIDRLVMLLTNRHSIRDVILFPHMRPEKRDDEQSGEAENGGEITR